ncbi:MAG: molybdopterin biosynthesis protein [Desulfobacterales bacterium]|nr:molybdopterin biosynthesis protein [Desulfobacterales bacterium]
MENEKRNIYLTMETLEKAQQVYLDHFKTLQLTEEMVNVIESVGRILSKPVFANISSPNYHQAAMDGIAVDAEYTFGASETRPKELIINTDAFFINTGQPMPKQTNAVIMIEHIHQIDESRICIEAPAFPFQHVRKIGEDIVATELLFPQGHEITPYCIGALLSGGIFQVSVKKRPHVLIIPTGGELVNFQDIPMPDLKPGQVIESNSYMISAMINDSGATSERHGIIKDDPVVLGNTIQSGIQSGYDIILVIGGSSAGSTDFAKAVISDLGTVLIHGVSMMPGKPAVLGDVSDHPVIGIPGYPVSAIMIIERFVQPLICQVLGKPNKERQKLMVHTTRKIPSKLGMDEFLRVKIGNVGGKLVATPLSRGSGCITSITEADGMMRIPQNVEGIQEYESVEVELLRSETAIQNTIVIVGSHDNSLDVLEDQLKSDHKHIRMSSTHVGSMGGLMAIKKGFCHVAGSHLLDPTDGSYNLSYIQKYLRDVPVQVIQFVLRDQGLIIQKGNPKNIQGIKDLCRNDIAFINRQPGSGTRILLDFELNRHGISKDSIHGYNVEESTHMAVAVAVQSGTVDVGLGIVAAANALKLDFIPIITEQYDLIIPDSFFLTDPIQRLMDTIQTATFKNRLNALGGYHTERTGEIIKR